MSRFSHPVVGMPFGRGQLLDRDPIELFFSRDGQIRCLSKGFLPVTFERTSEASVTDFEGLVQTGLAEEVRFDEARRVENFLGSTEDFSDAIWLKSGVTVDGTNIINFPAENTSIRQQVTMPVTAGNAFGGAFTIAGQGTINLRLARAGANSYEGTDVAITLSSNPKRFFITYQFTMDHDGLQLYITRVTGNTATQIYADFSQLEFGSLPSEYVSKGVLSGTPYHGVNVDGVAEFAYENGNSVDGNSVVTEAKGADLTTEWGALFEPASTNEAPQSLDFTTGGAAWATGGDCDTSETSSVSPVLYKNWWKLAAVVGGLSARSIRTQNITKDAAAEYWTQSLYVSKDEVTWLRLEIYNNDASSIVVQYYDLTNGIVGTPAATNWTHFNSTIVPAGTGNYYVTLTALTDAADTVIKTRITLAQSDGVATFTLNAGDGLLIQGHQLEEKRIATSQIPTAAAAVSRTIDEGRLMYDINGNLDLEKGSMVVDLRWNSDYNDISQAFEKIISFANFAAAFLYYASDEGSIYSYDGTNACKISLPFVANKTYRIGLTWSVDNGINLSWKNITDSGSWQTWANTPFSGAYVGSPNGKIRIGNTTRFYRPLRYRDLRIWLQDQGTQFIEDNY